MVGFLSFSRRRNQRLIELETISCDILLIIAGKKSDPTHETNKTISLYFHVFFSCYF